MKQQKSAFTLVEILVVIGIFAVLIAVGITALNSFSNRSYVNTATQDFYTTTKTLMQRARNSIYTNSELDVLKSGWQSTCALTNTNFPPDAIGYSFIGDEANYIKCSRNSSLSADFCCLEAEDQEVVMRHEEKTYIQAQNDCKGVIFEYATGEVYSFSDEDLLAIKTSDADCNVRVRHNDIDYFKTVQFNLEENAVQIKD